MKNGSKQSERIIFDVRRIDDGESEAGIIGNLQRGIKDYGDRLQWTVVIGEYQTYFWRR